ncbi:uncharacterized protein LOC119083847 [Bradysia coprophila]|uniref:uncharacterized protein LOC119083847 n=1 Tax=Bradysia coprophila TaxID=38358 RepID=UPI00187D8ADA|nr:uncharacterized protein LOC119083847 [Bradysia coprophila]
MNRKIVVLLLTLMLALQLQAQKDYKGTITKMCKSGQLKEIVNTCLKNQLKNPADEKTVSQMIDKKYVTFDQMLKDVCNTSSAASKKLVTRLFKLVTTQYSKIKAMFKRDPKACIMKYNHS